MDADDTGFALQAFKRNPDGTRGAAITPPPTLTTTTRIWVDSAAPDSWAVSLYGKVYLLSGTSRPFVAIGSGRYDLDPDPAELGLVADTGLQLDLLPSLALELSIRYHRVETAGPNLELFSSNAGVSIRF